MKYGLTDKEYAWHEKFNKTPITKLKDKDFDKHIKLLQKMIDFLAKKLNERNDSAVDTSPAPVTHSETEPK